MPLTQGAGNSFELYRATRGAVALNSRPTPGPADYGLLLALAAMWGGSFMLIKIAIVDVPPATLTATRVAIASAIIYGFAKLYGERLSFRFRTVLLLFLVGLFGNALPFTLISWGEETVDASLAAVLMGIMPIATLIFAHFWAEGEPLSARKLSGVAIGFAGLVVLVGPAVLLRLGDDGIRQLAILGAAVCYAINAILTKKLLGEPRIAAAAGLLFASALIMIPLSLFLNDPLSLRPGPAAWTAIVLLAALPTALAAILVFKLLDRQGAGFFGQVNLLVPPAGMVWAALILGERPRWNAYLALGFILVGIWVARGRQPHLAARARAVLAEEDKPS